MLHYLYAPLDCILAASLEDQNHYANIFHAKFNQDSPKKDFIAVVDVEIKELFKIAHRGQFLPKPTHTSLHKSFALNLLGSMQEAVDVVVVGILDEAFSRRGLTKVVGP